MSETKIALRKAIKQLYDTFEKYPKPDPTNELYPLSKHDLEIYYQSKIYDMPLRLIDDDIMLTHGTPEQYKHYLPRIFEFYFEPEGWTFWLTISYLTLANWFSWDKEEKDAVHNYLMALWHYILIDYQPKGKEYSRLDLVALECFEALMDVYPDISPFLEKWEQIDHIQASLHIMWILEGWWRNGFHISTLGRLKYYFPDADEQNKQRLLAWMGSLHVRKCLEELKPLKPDDEKFQGSLLMASYSHASLKK